MRKFFFDPQGFSRFDVVASASIAATLATGEWLTAGVLLFFGASIAAWMATRKPAPTDTDAEILTGNPLATPDAPCPHFGFSFDQDRMDYGCQHCGKRWSLAELERGEGR